MKRKRRFQNPWGKGGEYYNQSAAGGSTSVEPPTSLVSETGEGFYPGQTPTETPSSATDSINTGRLLQYEDEETEEYNPWAEDGEYYPDNVLDSKDPNDPKSVLYTTAVVVVNKNNLLKSIEPSNTNYSRYYDKKTGNYLGTDGEKSGKVYIADGVDNSKKGKQKFKGVIDLQVSHSTFVKFAGVIHEESTGDKEETIALGLTIINASRNGGWNIERLITNSNFTKAINKERYLRYVKLPNNNRYAFLGTINAFLYKMGDTSIVDISNGAILWEGMEFAKKGADQYKAKHLGIDIPKYHWTAFKKYWESTGKKSLKNAYGIEKVVDIKLYLNKQETAYLLNATLGTYKGRLLIKSTAVHGGTIFFGPNFWDARNNDFQYKYLSTFPTPIK